MISTATYGRAHPVRHRLEVGEGEVVALLGRNGAGKSTTFRPSSAWSRSAPSYPVFEGNDVSDQPTQCDRARRARLCAGGAAQSSRTSRWRKIWKSAASRRGRTAPRWTRERLFALFPNLAGCAPIGRAA